MRLRVGWGGFGRGGAGAGAAAPSGEVGAVGRRRGGGAVCPIYNVTDARTCFELSIANRSHNTILYLTQRADWKALTD